MVAFGDLLGKRAVEAGLDAVRIDRVEQQLFAADRVGFVGAKVEPVQIPCPGQMVAAEAVDEVVGHFVMRRSRRPEGSQLLVRRAAKARQRRAAGEAVEGGERKAVENVWIFDLVRLPVVERRVLGEGTAE